MVRAWLATSTSRHWATYQSSSRCTAAVRVRDSAICSACPRQARVRPGVRASPERRAPRRLDLDHDYWRLRGQARLAGPWNVSWNGPVVRWVHRVHSVRSVVLSVQLARLVLAGVFLVMNRSSVRFRQAALLLAVQCRLSIEISTVCQSSWNESCGRDGRTQG